MKQLFLILSFITITTYAQVGIGTTNPDNSAQLDITATNKGVLVPRVSLINVNSTTPIITPAQGLLVYNTSVNVAGVIGNAVGFYYYKGSYWERIISTTTLATNGNKYWQINGNSGTNPVVNFIGTTDNKNLSIRTNNIEKARITTKGQIEILNTGHSIFIGQGSGNLDDLSNNSNVGIGTNTLNINTSGSENVAVGNNSLRRNTTAQGNTAIGAGTLEINTTGYSNTASGINALNKNTTGNNNASFGENSLSKNTIGYENTAIGGSTMHENIIGSFNIAIGRFSLFSNTTGHYNVANGYKTLYDNTSGSVNNAFGYNALKQNTGNSNTAIGSYASFANTTGNNNVTIGNNAGDSDKFGSRNVYIGDSSGGGAYNPVTGTGAENKSGNVFIGYRSGFSENGNNKLYIDNTSANSNKALIYGEFGANNTTVGNILRTNSQFQIGNPTTSGYAFPTADGFANQLMQTNGNGQITFVNPSSVFTDTKNTLGQAYNEGGAGAGRIITTNVADVEIRGSFGLTVKNNIKVGNRLLHDGDVGNNIAFTTNRMVLSTNNRNYIDINNANNEVTFNENGGLQNFRIEVPTSPHIFFVDASTKKIGIKNAAPDAELDVNGTIDVVDNAGSIINIGGTNFSEDTISVSRSTSSQGTAIYAETTNTNTTTVRSAIETYNALTKMNVDLNQNNGGSFYGVQIKKNDLSTRSSTGVNVNLVGTVIANLVTNHHAFNASIQYNGGSAGSIYGYRTSISGTGAAKKYGTHITIPSSSGGIHYGIYSDARKNLGYAGYFIGRVSLGIGTTPLTRYVMPLADGTANQIMATNGAGQVNFVDINTLGANTLDQAYDGGGAGVGRTITADTGAVTVAGTDGFLVRGSLNSGSITPSGSGAKMYFNPRKAAFRAGFVSSTNWNDVNVGLYSFAAGLNTKATNAYSFAMGDRATASGTNATAFGTNTNASGATSFAIGYTTTASGGSTFAAGSDTEALGISSTALGNTTLASGGVSIAMGQLTVASGQTSTAMGSSTTASGQSSTAFGSGTTASGDLSISAGLISVASGKISYAMGSNVNTPSYLETAFGSYSTNYVPVSPTLWNNADRLFVVGNGANAANRSNALTIYKNGTININDAYNLPLTDGAANQIMATNGAGQVSFINPATVGTNTQNTLDQAYDEGGLGAGRIINTTHGAVGLNGVGGLNVRGATANIVIENQTEGESGIRFKDSGNNVQYAEIFYDNANTSNSLNFYVDNTTIPILRLDDNQNVGIKRVPTTNDLEVNGTASKSTAGSWLGNSDRRLKKNIVGISGKTALDKIAQMRGVNYEWNDNKTGIDRPKGRQLGFIAQELMQVFPNKVSKDNLGYYQTAYGDYDPIFVEAIKELNNKVKNLEAENNNLKQLLNKYASLEARISNIENKDELNTKN